MKQHLQRHGVKLWTWLLPKSFELIKTLVFKPKTAKTATPIPVVVIARDETETSSGALGKRLNLKELFAFDKISRMFIQSCKPGYALWRILISVSPLALTKDNFPKVLTVIDASIVSSSSFFAVHALSSSQTVFLSGRDIASYLSSLQSDEAKLQEIGFESLKTEGVAPAAPAKSR